jgi:hypothetical protein
VRCNIICIPVQAVGNLEAAGNELLYHFTQKLGAGIAKE